MRSIAILIRCLPQEIVWKVTEYDPASEVGQMKVTLLTLPRSRPSFTATINYVRTVLESLSFEQKGSRSRRISTRSPRSARGTRSVAGGRSPTRPE